MSSASAPVFTTVSVVCTNFPSFTPRRLIQVSTQIVTSATSRCGVSPSWIAFAGSWQPSAPTQTSPAGTR